MDTAPSTEPVHDNRVLFPLNLSREDQADGPATNTNENDFPEGGLRAWLVVLAAFLMLFPSLGFIVSIGALQEYWAQNQLSDMAVRDVAWIASVFVYLAMALGIWFGPIFDRYGPRWIVPLGSIGYLITIFLLAECHSFWQLLLCCGFLGGISGATLTTTSLAVVAHWFKAKRGFAQGICMTGSSFGGLVIPLILRSTLSSYGYAWSIRILGFLFTFCLIAANMLVKARLPPSSTVTRMSVISLSIFRDLRFALLTTSVFGFEVVLFGVLGILPTYVTLATDYSSETGLYLIAVLNASSCFGRILPGYAADRMGRFNTLLLMLGFTLVIMLAVWLPFGTNSIGALYVFAALFGFGTGSWMALTPACIGQLCEAKNFGRYYGNLYFVASIATLVCIPISGELVEIVGARAMIGFFCAVLALSSVSFVFCRWACLSRRWVIVEKV
ncbi:hypothetical protein S7711_09539 [Stachybotrys chartarum IBT 7711]|uniref:Major facilitator superfamily (MFS) profile domain-containing protein n=1 Tax=Stachybotrys chartarum (strain CBS 109288 / IBT 7711) TaxID=1280523 RepID=A0A084AP94_STACB|nr:hypothetical protein S7711_09539 [Stachybotrys chartarum IBT 7711]KFA50128.1 hypothetical protein S40293_06399 [Stachybotrys chartarum IBT 40293]